MEKILVANRGEIAVRVIKTAREQGYRTVAVYSEADAEALHVTLADEAVCIGPAPVGESYLSGQAILSAARHLGADAIHPGYGFLSENAAFARACEDAGIVFIGPSADAIELMGSKRLSKLAMEKAGVPCVPGYSGADQSDGTFVFEAGKIGYPVMIKASAGGGGRGMRLVEHKADLLAGIETARSEAANAFGSGELILEKAVTEPRHIEIQIFGDTHGNMVHLFERDCSIQRRHQKLVEEAPSPFMTEELRNRMGAAAVQAAKACNYIGAGTVEFLVDSNRNFYFLEMNTRLQVEHPVTEMVTGVDLVAWQLRVAEGQVLPLSQDDICQSGHAIEVRLYAEEPTDNFMPQTGRVQVWRVPERAGVRIDHGIRPGQVISPHYDPMLAKIIAYGPSRDAALRRLKSALQDTVLLGVPHNRAFLSTVISQEAFKDGEITTAFLSTHMTCSSDADDVSLQLARAAFIAFTAGQGRHAGGWSSAAGRGAQFMFEVRDGRVPVSVTQNGRHHTIAVNGFEVNVELISLEPDSCTVVENGIRRSFAYARDAEMIFLDGNSGHMALRNITHKPAVVAAGASDGRVKAPMDGAIIDVKVAVGDAVVKGDILVVMEAMKMEHSLKATADGIVESLSAVVGDQVKSRQILAVVAANQQGTV